MEVRAELLRRRIEAYRRVLAQGGAMWLVQLCLAEIARDQAGLDAIESRARKSS
jgi:hypothetical protein